MDYSQFCAENVSWETTFIPVRKGVKLFEIHFMPPKPSPFPPVIFLAGWGSLIYSWKIVLKDLEKIRQHLWQKNNFNINMYTKNKET